MSPIHFRLLMGYVMATWFGFALALYLLPIIETGSDFCRRGVHCDLSTPHFHSRTPSSQAPGGESEVPIPVSQSTRGHRYMPARFNCLRGQPSHPCRLLY